MSRVEKDKIMNRKSIWHRKIQKHFLHSALHHRITMRASIWHSKASNQCLLLGVSRSARQGLQTGHQADDFQGAVQQTETAGHPSDTEKILLAWRNCVEMV